MILSIHQPAYLPWLGYLHRIALSDCHVVLDHVQFERNSYINRNKVRTREGSSWLTVPVLKEGKGLDLRIDEARIDCRRDWSRKHRNSFVTNYGRSRYFSSYFPIFEQMLETPSERLASFLAKGLATIMGLLELKTKIVSSASLGLASRKADLVLDICRELGATTYISGPLGRQYLDHTQFAEHNIKLEFHDYVHPRYEQVYCGFEPYLSVVDLLFNHGPESRGVLLSPGACLGDA